MLAFDDAHPARDAVLSADGVYRYLLTRRWGPPDGPSMVMVMLNPSTADASVDDPTVTRCIGFAGREGAAGLSVVNLYAYRATDPDVLPTVPDPVGPDNDAHLRAVLHEAADTAAPVIAAWGVRGAPERVQEVVALAAETGVQFQALSVTRSGAPGHPLYLPAASPLTPWPQ